MHTLSNPSSGEESCRCELDRECPDHYVVVATSYGDGDGVPCADDVDVTHSE